MLVVVELVKVVHLRKVVALELVDQVILVDLELVDLEQLELVVQILAEAEAVDPILQQVALLQMQEKLVVQV